MGNVVEDPLGEQIADGGARMPKAGSCSEPERHSTGRDHAHLCRRSGPRPPGPFGLVGAILLAHAGLLARFGPTLGRPVVDTLKGSKIANLKELRFGAGGGVWRVAFAFDVQRIAVLLAAADKRLRPQARFYKAFIAVAERRWASWG